ncbi:(deoxy)nucleoside triphosphate pyrophosphohydrolase [Algoriphagus sp. C2-6-M1]|uniref:(deoxy)nucleoside triphosphate pyrophosphohydrolase n=1 Tax=Algoriphagus persicinus TaxID=3108754 RepID=UPI002B3B1F71|nr:(deoxy)nucleoside triphosphate pyrophosphohydrolase [Algoriphagus sp. C2-6-M1]MEB2781847.1 (deoxy)nucleoside triphosphate pyrophosphohydrolase [Algoriphagus sp. C2-6-M1]
MEVVLVTCALIFLDEKVLCAQRSEKMSLPRLWEFPGGKIEKKETPEACLIREIQEELAISIKVISSLRPQEPSYSAGIMIQLMPFICRWESGELILLEHQEVKWLPKGALKSLNWAPADIPIVDHLLENWNNIQKLLVDYSTEI